MKKEIRELLEVFQAAYDDKDINKADEFMTRLFVENTDIAIIGTSEGELCLDYDSCKELFVSDWKYWGFEKLNIDEAIVQELEDLTIVYVPSTYKFTFDDRDDANRESHFESILERLDPSKDKRNLKVKMGEIMYELIHMYHSYDSDIRTYRFDLKVSFVLNSDYNVIQINFSVPDNIKRPDSRLYQESQFYRYLNYELDKLKSKKTVKDDREIRDFLKRFTNDYFNNGEDYFDLKQLLVMNVDHHQALNKEEFNSLINYQNQYWDEISIMDDDAYIELYGNHAIVITKGIVKANRVEEVYFEETRKEIVDLASHEDLSIKDKMFKLRQLITIAFKETSIGNEYEHPIRLHLVLTKAKDEWKINYMNMSYAFYYLLDNRNEYMKRID